MSMNIIAKKEIITAPLRIITSLTSGFAAQDDDPPKM